MALVMPLSNEDKQRIREEEAFREQVRQEQRAARVQADQWKIYVFWGVLMAVAILMFVVVRSKG